MAHTPSYSSVLDLAPAYEFSSENQVAERGRISASEVVSLLLAFLFWGDNGALQIIVMHVIYKYEGLAVSLLSEDYNGYLKGTSFLTPTGPLKFLQFVTF
jgi:hypothetical protein